MPGLGWECAGIYLGIIPGSGWEGHWEWAWKLLRIGLSSSLGSRWEDLDWTGEWAGTRLGMSLGMGWGRVLPTRLWDRSTVPKGSVAIPVFPSPVFQEAQDGGSRHVQ